MASRYASRGKRVPQARQHSHTAPQARRSFSGPSQRRQFKRIDGGSGKMSSPAGPVFPVATVAAGGSEPAAGRRRTPSDLLQTLSSVKL